MGQLSRYRARSRAAAALVALALLTVPAPTAPVAGAVVAPIASAPSTGLVHRVDVGSRTLTLRLSPVRLRAPSFEVLLQRADGSYVERRVRRTHAYLGTVDRRPGAVAVAVRGRDGVLRGQLVSDRGATTWFAGHDVTGTRGTTPPTSYHWPSSSTADRNQTVGPRQAGSQTYRWDIGYDVESSYFLGTLGGSVARAVDAIELATVEVLATYERDARLRPAIGRIVLRGSDSVGPYAGLTAHGDLLSAARTEWGSAQDDTPWDAAALLHDKEGGGLGYVGSIGGDYAVTSSGGDGSEVVLRHELGHNWGPSDNHTNGPEGPTIESGNQYARFDGTEVRSIFLNRNEALGDVDRPLTPVRPLRQAMPPYAALDLVDSARTGYPRRLRPARNDHDANGDRVRLLRVARRSHLGARLTMSGGQVSFTAPAVGASDTVDWFTYVVTDGHGRRATGVVLVRIDP